MLLIIVILFIITKTNSRMRRFINIRVQTRHLAVFCVKLTYNSEFTVVKVVELPSVNICAFLLCRGVDPVLKVGGGAENQFIYTYMYACIYNIYMCVCHIIL